MKRTFNKAKTLYDLEGYEFFEVPGHDGGRNTVYICLKDGERKGVLRISLLDDRSEEDFLAETEFVKYLADEGAPVADVIKSANGKLVERIEEEGQTAYAVLFEYAKGMLLYDNGYKYREGAPIEEYFYNMGKTLGSIHRISKTFKPEHKRISYFDKYNMDYIDKLIPDSYSELKEAVSKRLDGFKELPVDENSFGLVHFDYSDGNYHIDMSTGDITVFDFDNCMYCWYMFDLANAWTHGVGWCQFEQDPAKRMEFMKHYFDTILEGYRSETEVDEKLLEKLPMFIDMVLIENVVDEFECAAHEGEEVDYEDIEAPAECLINNIPYAGVGENS